MRADPSPGRAGPGLVLRPDPVRARWWATLSLLLVVMTLVVAVTSGDGVIEWIGVAVAVAVAVYFLVPVVSPDTTTLVLDADGVHGRMYHVPVDVPWELVQVARVVRVVGEPVLELHLREPGPHGRAGRTRAVGILLPIGTDLVALRELLATRTALGGLRAGP